MESIELRFNSLSGAVPSCFGSLKELSTVRIDNNNFRGSLPKDLCNAPIDSLDVDNIGQVCYPACLYPVLVGGSSLPRCIGDEDMALCSFINATNVKEVTSNGGWSGKAIIVESQHPYQFADEDDVSQLISIPGAISYSVSFFENSHMYAGNKFGCYSSDYILICDDKQECSSTRDIISLAVGAIFH